MITQELLAANRTYKMKIGERRVEVTQDENGWVVSNGNIFANSWQSVWCPDINTMLQVQEQISSADWAPKKQLPIPDGCKLIPYNP